MITIMLIIANCIALQKANGWSIDFTPNTIFWFILTTIFCVIVAVLQVLFGDDVKRYYYYWRAMKKIAKGMPLLSMEEIAKQEYLSLKEYSAEVRRSNISRFMRYNEEHKFRFYRWKDIKYWISIKKLNIQLHSAFRKGLAASRTEDYMMAIEAYTDAIVISPSWIFLFNKGIALRKLGRLDEALEAYNSAARLREESGLPTYPDLMKNSGAVYMAKREYLRAYEIFKEAEYQRSIQSLPPDPGLSLNIGGALYSMNRCTEALEAFEIAKTQRESLGYEPDPRIIVNIGVTYSEMGDYIKAHEMLSAAENMYTEKMIEIDYELLNALGNSYKQLNQLEIALQYYHKGNQYLLRHRLAPNAGLIGNIGEILRMQKKYLEAIDNYDRAQEILRDQDALPDPGITYNKALALYAMGDKEEACTLAHQAKKMFQQQGLVVYKHLESFLAEHCGN